MAVTGIVNLSQLEFVNRIDGELYNPLLKRSYEYLVLSHFKIKKLRELCIIRSGTTPPDRNDSLKEGPVLFKTTDIRNNVISPHGDFYHISEKIHDRMWSTKLRPFDVLFNIVGATLDVIGRSGYISNFFEEANITQAMVLLRCINDDIKPGYLFTYLNTKYAQDQVKRYARPTGQYNLNLMEVGQISIPILEESKQYEINELVNLSSHKLKESDELFLKAQQLLRQEFRVYELEFKKSVGYETSFSEILDTYRNDAEYYNPLAKKIVIMIKSFPHSKLGDDYSIGNGFPWRSDYFLSDNSGEPVVRIRDIKPGSVVIENLTSIVKKYADSIGLAKAEEKDIVIGMDGIKYFYASMLEGSCYVNQRVAHLKQKPNAKISPEYASFIINSELGQAQLLKDMTIATTVGHITNKNITNLVIPYLSKEFHDKITELVRGSLLSRKESKNLLEQAKTRVEELIEKAGES